MVSSSNWVNPLPGVPDVESPFFAEIFLNKSGRPGWFETAEKLHRDGYAVIRFPDEEIDALAANIVESLGHRFDLPAWRKRGWKSGGGLRVQDAWQDVEAVRRIAVNAEIADLLTYLYGRRAFPFQTLNFPVGTQQHFHTDSVHFSSLPERFMCGVWLALEDIDASNGPLIYYPGSHVLPIWKNEHVGHVPDGNASQLIYHRMWSDLMKAKGIEPIEFHARKGEALIWAANLFHGGQRHIDPSRTRWSQVTHYLFDDCRYYTPMSSDESVGHLDLRSVTDISTGEVRSSVERPPRPAVVPEGFDAARYLEANPDVKAAGVDPTEHYLNYGRLENRRWGSARGWRSRLRSWLRAV